MRKVIIVCALIVLLSLGILLLGATGHSVALSWVASPTPNVNYNVYRSGTSGGPYSQINSGGPVVCCAFTDTLVSSGATYYYVVRAFDGTSESADSNQFTAVIPQAPQPAMNLTGLVK